MMKTNKLGMRRSLRRNIPLCLSSSSSQSEQLAFRSILFSCFCFAAQHYLRQQSNSHSPLLHFSPLPLSSLSFSLSLISVSPLSYPSISPLPQPTMYSLSLPFSPDCNGCCVRNCHSRGVSPKVECI